MRSCRVRREPEPVTPKDRRLARLLGALVALAFVLLTRGHFVSSDEVAMYQTTQSLWRDGDLSIEPCAASVIRGAHGEWESRYGLGQAILALPFYAAGEIADAGCRALGLERLRLAFAQSRVAGRNMTWSGETPIFFVMLLTAAAGGLLCAGFFLLARRFGASRRASLLGALALAFASHPGTFAGQYFGHALESALLLWAVLLIVEERPLGAGLVAALLVLVRVQGVLALPFLTLYAAGARHPIERAIRRALPFAVPAAGGVVAVMVINWHRYGSPSLSGGYSDQSFHSSYADGLFGLVLSPGESVFLFSPLLVLAVAAAGSFTRRRPREAALVAALFATWVGVHAAFTNWHGQNCFGPRYLACVVGPVLAIVPAWVEEGGVARRAVAGALAALGLVVSMLSFLVDYWRVILADHLDVYADPSVLFVPSRSQLLAHVRALLAWDERADFWLREAWQQAGPAIAMALVAIVVTAIILLARRIVLVLRSPDAESTTIEATVPRAAVGIAVAVALTLTSRWILGAAAAPPSADVEAAPPEADVETLRSEGLAALRMGDFATARARFESILSTTPSDDGASYQLGVALDGLGRSREAAPHFESVLEKALVVGDETMRSLVLQRLTSADRPIDEVMQEGMEALYQRRRPHAAAELFEEVLHRKRDHYGAIYQLAVAFDRTQRRDRARPLWEEAARLARAYGDRAGLDAATKRLAEPD